MPTIDTRQGLFVHFEHQHPRRIKHQLTQTFLPRSHRHVISTGLITNVLKSSSLYIWKSPLPNGCDVFYYLSLSTIRVNHYLLKIQTCKYLFSLTHQCLFHWSKQVPCYVCTKSTTRSKWVTQGGFNLRTQVHIQTAKCRVVLTKRCCFE
jgi:hypothetical protein